MGIKGLLGILSGSPKIHTFASYIVAQLSVSMSLIFNHGTPKTVNDYTSLACFIKGPTVAQRRYPLD